ncbi:MAG: nucleotidyl transferase AbiEii/AbiGii toxin family protein [Erysipelotrichaceae bacterium]|nr:nucleotidyl transferase AbiEii/AbiGii toxin family protein [Erysipelotrichaceae bacterium]
MDQSSLKNFVTIKGGLVVQKLSNNVRRVTKDIDFDFIHYSLSDSVIEKFVYSLNCVDDLSITYVGCFTELNQQDYKGKRIYLNISDHYNNSIGTKIDIGVHNNLDIYQEELLIDVCIQEDAIQLLVNSREQIIVEKLKSLLRFMSTNTRFKDVFDICFLLEDCDVKILKKYLKIIIYGDNTMPVSNDEELLNRLEKLFGNAKYMSKLNASNKNWLDISVDETVSEILEYFKKL